jgi:hypothetical protein
MTRAGRLFSYGLIAVGLLETLGMNVFTLVQIRRARTSVPYSDEWALVQDLAQMDRGHAVWPILWAPYWGERQVVTRLLWMANARFHALASLTWLTMLFQFAHIGILMGLAWLLLRRNAAAFVLACIAILNLLLSPFQMWNFVWSTQTMFVLVCLTATGSFLCLAMAQGKRRPVFDVLSVALAALGSLTMPNGLLVWPVLVVQALYLKRGWRAVAVLTTIGTFAIASYLWHYSRPDMGMGVVGVLRHPVQAILLVGVVVAGPVAFISNPAAAACGVLAMAVTGYVAVCALRFDGQERRWLSALVAIVVCLVLSSVSVVAGRLDARFLGRDPIYSVPVRYPTMVSVLWAAIALLAIYTCWHRQVRPVLLSLYAAPLLYMMFATAHLQYVMAEDWADFFRGADAAGAAFLLDAPDEQLLSRLWPVPAEREGRVAFLRQRNLAMFHEPRATWMGKNVAELFSPPASGACVGAIEKTTPLAGGIARVQGWAWDTQRGDSPDYVLLADGSGRIVGQARGGLRHGYIPGLLVEAGNVPESHARFRHSEWLGYVRIAADPVQLFGLFAGENRVCKLEPRAS